MLDTEGLPLTGIVAVETSRTTTCALRATGGAMICWGSDTYGLMGNGGGVSDGDNGVYGRAATNFRPLERLQQRLRQR